MARKRFETPVWLLLILMAAALAVAVWAVAKDSIFGDSESRVEITADNIAFDTDEIALTVGVETVIQLANDDSVAHAFTVDELGIDLFAERKQSVSVTLTPEEAGTFAFYCKLHPTAMTGTVRVNS